MLGVYLSGTGNTKHCVEKLTLLLDERADFFPLEYPDAIKAIEQHDEIVLGYPVQFSNIPYMVRDFIHTNEKLWKNKKVFCVATMGGFSGDGAGCAARLLKKYGATILGGLHIKMPDSVCDGKRAKKSMEENREIIAEADKKIEMAAQMIKQGKYPRNGICFWSRLAGFFGQRLWFYGKTKEYSDKLKISGNCIGCGLCEAVCPMKNISILNGKAVAGHKCTMCYRCVSHCPEQAITLLGEHVTEQYRFEKYSLGEESAKN